MAHYYATREMGLQVVAFAVDAAYRTQDRLLDTPVIDSQALPSAYPPGQVAVFVAVGYRSLPQREEAWQRMHTAGYQTPSIVSRHAFLAQDARLGPNSIVMPGSVVEPGVVVGTNTVIWSNVTICHDTVVGDHNFFASNVTVGGEVRLGSRSFFGFSSVVVQQVTVGDDVLLAAQSLLLADAPGLTHYQGSPARACKAIDRAVGVCIA
jgi:sugar O-acyltransferase (sialic acid O-acetyltransferase NeuD family)